jgi:TetR/AcrR family transcriptional regulator
MSDVQPVEGGEGIGGRMRADERREQLIRVAIEVFSKKGFSGATTKEIARAAGVTEALIFRHFPSKEALYEAILRWKVEKSGFEEKWAELRARAERRDDAGVFGLIATSLLQFHRENVDFLRLMFYAILEDHQLGDSFRDRQVLPIYEFLTDYVSTRQREGAFVDGLNPGAVVRAVLGMPFYHSIVNNLFRCNILQIDDEEAVDAFIHIALNGLRRRPETIDNEILKDEK